MKYQDTLKKIHQNEHSDDPLKEYKGKWCNLWFDVHGGAHSGTHCYRYATEQEAYVAAQKSFVDAQKYRNIHFVDCVMLVSDISHILQMPI